MESTTEPELQSTGRLAEPLAAARARPHKVIGPRSLSSRALVRNLRALAGYRDLIGTLSLHRIKVRYKQSLLGPAWAIAQPVALMVIYTVIFSRFAKMPSEGVPYALFAYAALLPWTYFASAVTTSTSGLVSNVELIRKVYFPREILPLSYIITALFDFLVASIVVGGLMVHYGVAVTPRALYIFPLIIIATVFATAMALFLSAAQVWFRDFGVGLPLLLQAWMFATPVVYPLAAVPSSLRSVYDLNPMVGVVENFRRVLVQDSSIDAPSLLLSGAVSVVLLPVAYAWFKYAEATMADVI
jgi:lipopolysaccharide transport system permease protein